jgi:hypothetical protein
VYYLNNIIVLILETALSLAERYKQAVETSNTADIYFEKMKKGISVRDQSDWERQIRNAESQRMETRSVMDILGARHPNVEETELSGHLVDKVSRGSATEWIQLGIDIEENQ